MVGHIPLEDVIGVRVPDRQQKPKVFLMREASKEFCLRLGLEQRSHILIAVKINELVPSPK